MRASKKRQRSIGDALAGPLHVPEVVQLLGDCHQRVGIDSLGPVVVAELRGGLPERLLMTWSAPAGGGAPRSNDSSTSNEGGAEGEARSEGAASARELPEGPWC